MVNDLIAEITNKKDVYTRDATNTLPDLHAVWQNHHLMAVYVEKCIGEELVQHGGIYIPDRTSCNKVWEMSATVLKINGKIRAIKAQRIGKGDCLTWVDVILHMLQRLTVASGHDIMLIWGSIKTMLSDLCKVNMLASEVSKLIGSSWIYGQLLCVLHYVLEIPESIKATFALYQGQIGRDKLFSRTNGFKMNINNNVVVVQILKVWLRFTSICWHGLMWNR